MPFLLFIIVPVCELWLLFTVGAAIGFFPTLLLILLTAFIGINLIRREGMKTYSRFLEESQRGEIPNGPIFDGICILIAGAFLLTPGLITDTVGFLLLTPVVRSTLGRFLIERVPFGATIYRFRSSSAQQSRDNAEDIIDIEFEDTSERD